ncbi:alpha/beta hydrolase [Roseomonas xinghualingensis]|uniref:alpha/beta hydrolase n=1 Tax=Roseomonas xinghualingensis TaxID=2986475 RepID=UPI0021F1FC2B|nr:alpha/beta hydrolase-fold protein [Roseomonas sp. SXEYE001]MCV4208421.1 alpha/beta hydrolase-fold protein [Roseomonas sp. SXEYE001]
MTPAPHPGSSVTLPRSEWWDMCAGDDPARRHRILLAWPEQPPPPGGFPVLFLTDGNATFATAADALRARSWRGAAEDIAPALIVGLGHPGTAAFDIPSRMRDYTPPVAEAQQGSGGADAFLDFIEAELLPELERRFPVDRARLALFGHSFGGLLALHALFTRPGLFRRLVAASPSLWWAGGATMEAARHFAAAPPPGTGNSALLITVGELEGQDDAGNPRAAIRAARRMAGNARDLATLLAGAWPAVDFVSFPGEKHGSVIPAAIARALPFTLPPDPGAAP